MLEEICKRQAIAMQCIWTPYLIFRPMKYQLERKMMFYSDEEDNRYDMEENPGPDDMMKPLKKAI